MYPWTRKSLLNFGSPYLDADSADPDHILLGGHMRSLTAVVNLCDFSWTGDSEAGIAGDSYTARTSTRGTQLL